MNEKQITALARRVARGNPPPSFLLADKSYALAFLRQQLRLARKRHGRTRVIREMIAELAAQ